MDKSLAKEAALLEALKAHLEEGKLARSFVTEDEDEIALLSSYNLLTGKPVIFAANVSEEDLADDGAGNTGVQAVKEFAAGNGSEVFVICAQIEQEIAELDEEEKAMFLEDLGLSESGLEKLIRASYSLLGLLSFLTSGEDETRAWTIKVGTKAPQAAGKIHSDLSGALSGPRWSTTRTFWTAAPTPRPGTRGLSVWKVRSMWSRTGM